MATGETAQAACALLSAGAAVWVVHRLAPLRRSVEQHAGHVEQQLVELRRAHEDHVDRVSRRMCDVERAATAAENEGRIISKQMAFHEVALRQIAECLGVPHPRPAADHILRGVAADDGKPVQ